MPDYNNWLYHIELNNPERRERDRIRKSKSGVEKIPKLASYHRIDKHLYRQMSVDGYIVRYYRLSDIAKIYGLTSATVHRWYRAGMLPEFFGSGNEYIKEQVLVICNVLNDLFGQGIRQFRNSHIGHIEMMRAGNEMALRRFNIKLAKGPKQPVRILPHPREWARLAEIRKKRFSYAPYQPTLREILCDSTYKT